MRKFTLNSKSFLLCILLLISCIKASATINGGNISLKYNSLLTNAQTCMNICLPTYSTCYPTIYNYTSPSGSSAGYSYSWEVKFDSGRWTIISGATLDALNNVPPPQQRGKYYYRRKATDLNNPNDTAYSNVVYLTTWTVYHGNIGFAPGGSSFAVVTAGNPPPRIENPTGYSDHPYTWYMYQKKTGINGSWTDAAQILNNNTFYPPTQCTADTIYYRSWLENDCSDPDSGFTNTIQLIFQAVQPLTPGTVTVNKNAACPNTPIHLTGTPVNNPTSSTFSWQYSSDSLNWTNMPNSTNIDSITDYDFTYKKYYRRLIKNPCETVYSNVVVVNIISVTFNPGTISSTSAVICPNIPVLLTGTVSNVASPYTFTWQSSTDSLTWTNLTNSTNFDSLTISSVSAKTYFRRAITYNNCATLYSNVIVVNTSIQTGVYGQDKWIAYASNGANGNALGYYEDNNLNINTNDNWAANLSPQYASNYIGCNGLDTNNFKTEFLRKGFVTGNYQIYVKSHNAILSVEKDMTNINLNGTNDDQYNIHLGTLNSNSKLKISHFADTTNTPLQLRFINPDFTVTNFYSDSVCKPFKVANVSGNGVIPFIDTLGNVIATINPNNVNLGAVTVLMKHSAPGANNIPVSNTGKSFMPRYFQIKGSNFTTSTFPTPVTLRLYFQYSEFLDYKTATNQPLLFINDLKVIRFNEVNQDCELYNNNSTADTLPLLRYGFAGADALYYEVTTNRYGEFGLSRQMNVLPVKWLSIGAERKNNKTEVTWSVAQEINNAEFKVMRSTNGTSFEPIATIAGKGNSNQQTTYSYSDENMPLTSENVYYRIMQTDKDGRSSLSNIAKVKTIKTQTTYLHPNPVANTTTLSTTNGTIVHYTIMDVLGKIVRSQNAYSNKVILHTAEIKAGTYLLRVTLSNGTTETLKLVK